MNKVIEMKQIMELFFITVLAAGISFGNAFAHDPVSRNKINTSLNLPQVFECENLAKKIVKKLRAQGLTDKQIIDAFADEIATNVDGEHDEKTIFSSKMTLVVAGVVLTGLAGILVYLLLHNLQRDRITRSQHCQILFAPGYSPTPDMQRDAQQLARDIEHAYSNDFYNYGTIWNRRLSEFRQRYPQSMTGTIEIFEQHRVFTNGGSRVINDGASFRSF